MSNNSIHHLLATYTNHQCSNFMLALPLPHYDKSHRELCKQRHMQQTTEGRNYMYYALVLALIEGDLNIAEQLLDAGADPSGPDHQFYETVICLALTLGPDAVKLVVNYGALNGCDSFRYYKILSLFFFLTVPTNTLDALFESDREKVVKEFNDYMSLTYTPETLKAASENYPIMEKVNHIQRLISRPRSLFSLSKQAVVQCLGPMPARREKVQHLAVPNLVQQDLCDVDQLDLTNQSHGNNVSFEFVLMQC